MRRGRGGIDLPAAFQGAGREALPLSGAARQDDAKHAASFGGKLQPAAGSQVHRPVRFADYRAQFRAAQAFFHGPEHVGLVRAADDDQPLRVEPESGEARSVQVGARAGIDAPQHRAGDPPGEHRCETAGRAAAQFMHRTPGEPALRQAGIDARKAQGDWPDHGVAPFDDRDIGAKLLDDLGAGHVPSLAKMFLFCSILSIGTESSVPGSQMFDVGDIWSMSAGAFPFGEGQRMRNEESSLYQTRQADP